MTEYYFDTETTGFDPLKCKIITIQWQRLSWSGEPIGELNILKEWKSSEEAILKEFLPNLRTTKPFDFIPVGKNLLFDFLFLSKRAERYGLNGLDLQFWHDKPFLDIKPILIMINEGNFAREEFKAIPEIKEAHLVYGVYDIITRLETDIMQDLKDTISQKIRRIEKIRSTLTMIVY